MEKPAMPRALITGITGQDGSYLADLLLTKGYTVYGMVRRSSSPNYERIEHILDSITLIQGDLLDQSSLSRAIDIAQPDEVYNLAAQTHVGESFKQPVATAEYTGLGCLRLLEALRLSGGHARFYQASTSELFGNAHYVPQDEQTPFAPRSPYAVAKMFAHHTTINYRQAYGIFACCSIMFNHESPRRGLDFVTRKITDGVARIKCGLQDTLELGNVNAQRDWGYAKDYVRAMWLMLQQAHPSDYVIATGESHSVEDFLEEAFSVAGLAHWSHYVKINESLYRPTDIHDLCGNASKAQKKLGWNPTVSFNELVSMMVHADIRRYSSYAD